MAILILKWVNFEHRTTNSRVSSIYIYLKGIQTDMLARKFNNYYAI